MVNEKCENKANVHNPYIVVRGILLVRCKLPPEFVVKILRVEHEHHIADHRYQQKECVEQPVKLHLALRGAHAAATQPFETPTATAHAGN